MLGPERLVSILQLRYKLLQLVLGAFREFIQLRPLQDLQQDGRHLLLTLYPWKMTVNGHQTLVKQMLYRPQTRWTNQESVKSHSFKSRISALNFQNKASIDEQRVSKQLDLNHRLKAAQLIKL